MLPLEKSEVGKDWMGLFTSFVWGTTILLMFLAKLKGKQEILIGIIMTIGMIVFNADVLFGGLRIQRVFLVLKKSLWSEFKGTWLIGLIAAGVGVLEE